MVRWRQHNEPYLGRVEQFRVKTSDVLSYSEAIGRGTFAEEEIIVPRSVLKDLSYREKLALLLGGEGSGISGTPEGRGNRRIVVGRRGRGRGRPHAHGQGRADEARARLG